LPRNNAGIYSQNSIEDVNPDDFNRLFNLNVLGLMLSTKHAVKIFNDKGGSIINISSIVANGTVPGVLIYSATKGAVNTITTALSHELGPRKIRVNAISPGMVETEGLHAAGIAESEFRTQMEAITPLGRIGQPIDIASAVLYLVSDAASWVTGQNLTVSGGVM
jgi:3-oxoacyl-[acyl-carrier protein] reductase